LPESTGSLGMAINHSVEVLQCLPAEPAARAAAESPVIVGSIAILAVIVSSCLGMIATVLWDTFTSGAGPHWGAQSCSCAFQAIVITHSRPS
jgi:hypothetical protein